MAAPRMAKLPGHTPGPQKDWQCGHFFKHSFEVSTYMMNVPKMPSNTPTKMVTPQARVPMMQNLRDGGGTMKVFGGGHVPRMSGQETGGKRMMKK
jgi:hypothetical protein